MAKTTSDPCGTCSHPGYSHSTQGRCLACLKCLAFVWPTRCADAGCGMVHGPQGSPDGYHEVHGPAMVSITSDQYEGLKAEVSFANSRAEELEKLRREAANRASNLARDNFDLMRQKARAESKLACLAGRHGIVVGTECKECGVKNVEDQDSWLNRPTVQDVSIEAVPNVLFQGPYVFITPDERASIHLNWDKAAELAAGYLARIVELEALLSETIAPWDRTKVDGERITDLFTRRIPLALGLDPEEPDTFRSAIEDEQEEQARIEAEDVDEWHTGFKAHDPGHSGSENLHRHREDGGYEQYGFDPDSDWNDEMEAEAAKDNMDAWTRLQTYGPGE